MFDPAEASRQIKREFIDYITTSDRFADARMRESFRRNLESQLSKGPIVDIKDSFRPTKSIEELINEGIGKWKQVSLLRMVDSIAESCH